VIGIPTSMDHVSNMASYTNAIPISRPDGSTLLIMPSFPGIDGSGLIEAEIRNRLEQEGFVVVFVEDEAYGLFWSTHCMIGNFD